MIKKLTTGILCLILFLVTFNLSFAQNIEPSITPEIKAVDVKLESVNPPDGMPYFFKRVREKVSLFLAFSDESKVKIYQGMVRVRLAELKYVVEKKEMGYFEQTTLRYFSTAGQLTSVLMKSNKKDQSTLVKNEFSSQIPVLEKLRDNYDATTAEWRFIQDDINYLKGYMNDLSG